jgi:hypothetical protein
MPEKKLSLRSFVSFTTLFSFVSLGLTGILLYVIPEGRVAYWTHWRFLGLSKDIWTQVHTLSALLFIVASIIHIVLNWKPLWGYVISKARGTLNHGWELAAGFLLTVLFVISAIYLLPPLDTIIHLGQAAKDSWIVSPEFEPPFGHAEEASLKTLCTRMNIDLQQAVAELRSAGIKFDSPRQTLEEIAVANSTSPMQLYSLFSKHIKAFKPQDRVAFTEEEVERNFTGAGFGRETLASAAERLKMDLPLVRQRLAAHGISIADEETLKSAADRLGTEVIQILKYILIETNRAPSGN